MRYIVVFCYLHSYLKMITRLSDLYIRKPWAKIKQYVWIWVTGVGEGLDN